MQRIMTTEEKVKNCLNRHPDWDIKRVTNATRSTQADVKAVQLGQSIQTSTGGEPTPAGYISLESVIQKYDIRAAILKEIAKLPPGRLLSEAELCSRTAGTDRNRFRRTIENNSGDFKTLRISLRIDESKDTKWYWGGAQDIAAALKIRDI